jgi:hypothetical protein
MEQQKQTLNRALEAIGAPRYTLRACRGRLSLCFNENNATENDIIRIQNELYWTYDLDISISYRYTSGNGMRTKIIE